MSIDYAELCKGGECSDCKEQRVRSETETHCVVKQDEREGEKERREKIEGEIEGKRMGEDVK